MCSKIFVKIHAVLRKLHMIQHMTTHTCWPCAPSPQGAPPLSSVLTMIAICPHVPLPISQNICQVVKKMSSYQKDVKLSKRCQMSNTWTMEEVHKKNINWHNEVHTYWCQFWRDIWWWPKTLKMCIESVFEQFWWPSYLTSKLTSICVNPIMWIYFFCEPPP